MIVEPGLDPIGVGFEPLRVEPDPRLQELDDRYELPPEELKDIPTVCGSLREALAALDTDRAFLTEGGVFDDDQIDAYIELKMEEVLAFEQTPHPIEFQMYYSV